MPDRRSVGVSLCYEKRDGSHYADLAGVALESQFPPDSPSHGRALLLPGQTYRRTTRFDFRF